MDFVIWYKVAENLADVAPKWISLLIPLGPINAIAETTFILLENSLIFNRVQIYDE